MLKLNDKAKVNKAKVLIEDAKIDEAIDTVENEAKGYS